MSALPAVVQAGPVETFHALCVKHLSDPAAIVAAAKKAGFKMTSVGANNFIGDRKKTDESVQINAFTQHKFECAVTTSDVADPKALYAQFMASVGIAKPRHNPSSAKINGKKYSFLYDTTGGEALIVYAE
jgi:hypothetical protein